MDNLNNAERLLNGFMASGLMIGGVVRDFSAVQSIIHQFSIAVENDYGKELRVYRLNDNSALVYTGNILFVK